MTLMKPQCLKTIYTPGSLLFLKALKPFLITADEWRLLCPSIEFVSQSVVKFEEKLVADDFVDF